MEESKQEQIDQLKQVIEFLQKGSLEQKDGALDILMPYSGTTKTRLLFLSTEGIKELLRVLHLVGEEDDVKKIEFIQQNRVKALKCLINFSQDEVFIKEMCNLNAANRLYDILKENVKQNLKNVELVDQLANNATFKQEEGIYEIFNPATKFVLNEKKDKLEIDKGDFQEQTIEFALMLLSNISGIEYGQKHILGLSQEKQSEEDLKKAKEKKQEFIILESIFGMFCYFSKNTSFDFISNIVANLACQTQGRKFMIDHNWIEAIVVQMIKHNLNQHRRQYLIQCIRNILFEYLEYEQKFLDMNVPKDICKLLIDEQGIKSKLPDKWPQEFRAKNEKENDEINLNNTVQLLDGLVLLSHTEPLMQRMREIHVLSLLKRIYIPRIDKYQETIERIETLQDQLGMDPAMFNMQLGEEVEGEETIKQEDFVQNKFGQSQHEKKVEEEQIPELYHQSPFEVKDYE